MSISISIDNAFVKQFEREVFEAYQRMGSKLRTTVRSKSNIKGSSTTFQKVGSGTASTKSTHGMVPVMNLAHTAVEATLYDYYAGDWIDTLDIMPHWAEGQEPVAIIGHHMFYRLEA